MPPDSWAFWSDWKGVNRMAVFNWGLYHQFVQRLSFGCRVLGTYLRHSRIRQYYC